jgi:hypothetical protein
LVSKRGSGRAVTVWLNCLQAYWSPPARFSNQTSPCILVSCTEPETLVVFGMTDHELSNGYSFIILKHQLWFLYDHINSVANHFWLMGHRREYFLFFSVCRRMSFIMHTLTNFHQHFNRDF